MGEQKQIIMKKITSILTALLFIFSFTLSAQNVAADSNKKTNDTECENKDVKENKKSKGFNFTSKKSAENASCCASKKTTDCSTKNKTAKAECSSKAKKTSCSDSKKTIASSCCSSKNNSKAYRSAAEKVRQAIAKGEITTEQGNARL